MAVQQQQGAAPAANTRVQAATRSGLAWHIALRKRFKHQGLSNSSGSSQVKVTRGGFCWSYCRYSSHNQEIIKQLIVALKEGISAVQMDRSDLELVLAIRDQGSLAAAALSLHVAAPMVTKRLAALEARLGQKLFQRTTRRVSATAEGDTLCDRASVLLQGFAALEAELQERKAEATGLIRLAATFGFGRLWLGPALASFQLQHPRIEVQLQLTEQLPDLAAEGYDGAIWLWQVEGRQAAQWVSRRLARNQRVLVASPAYLQRHGTPTTLEDLPKHACLIARENGNTSSQRFDVWTLQRERDKAAVRVRV
jgi:DNA-binding transcriptional LysR family regulator